MTDGYKLIRKLELEYKAEKCLAISLNPSSSDWAKSFWKTVAEKLFKKAQKVVDNHVI